MSLVLVVGDPVGELSAITTLLSESDQIEMRLTTSHDEAIKVLGEVPVAMVMSQEGIPGPKTGTEFLEWVRGKFPSIRRVLISDHADPSLIVKAVNRAAIHYFVPVPFNLRKLDTVVEELLFS